MIDAAREAAEAVEREAEETVNREHSIRMAELENRRDRDGQRDGIQVGGNEEENRQRD